MASRHLPVKSWERMLEHGAGFAKCWGQEEPRTRKELAESLRGGLRWTLIVWEPVGLGKGLGFYS